MSNETKWDGMEKDAALARLQDLFDAYGSDMGRWPPSGRQLFNAHAADPAVGRMATEAHAFDRLLSQPGPDAEVRRIDALSARIMAAAAESPRHGGTSSNVLPFAGRSVPSSYRITVATRRAGYAALAASLVLGLLVGTSGAGTQAISYLSGQTNQADESEVASSSIFSPAVDEVL